MAELVAGPTRIPVPGGKTIDEYVGRVNTGETAVSIAHMVAPPGWSEPAQRPEFDEYTLVLRGRVRVDTAGGVIEVSAGQAVVTRAGERVRYSTGDEGAEYVAVCLPAFGPQLAGREDAADAGRQGPDGPGREGPAGDSPPYAPGEPCP
jgi:quercetin dioxygenase-like cupin family protein